MYNNACDPADASTDRQGLGREPKKPAARRATLEALASARSTPATRAELKTTLETLGVDFKSSDSTKYLQRKLEVWLEEN